MTAYALGIDLGTTYSAAAIGRGSTAQPLSLGVDAAQIPSVVLLRDTGEVLVGDAAERRASLEPTRVAREFKRRLGDPVPMVVGGVAQPIESLMAQLLRWIIDAATRQEGEPPTVVVLTHPANYLGYKLGVLREAARLAGVDEQRLILLTEPEAAAIAYSRQQRLDVGDVVAIYDFGGGTFDAAVVRRNATGFELIGVPEGMERLGGIDFDQAVLAHVDTVLQGRLSELDAADAQTMADLGRLRTECRRAKEALSTDDDAVVSVVVPGVRQEVRLTRGELDAMAHPRVLETVRALQRAVASAGLEMDQVSRVLLVGGTSRMPVVGSTIARATARPVAVDIHPKLAIAVGAALAGAAALPREQVAEVPAAWSAPVPAAAAGAREPFRATPQPAAPGRSKRQRRLIAAGVGAVVGLAAVVAVIALSGGSDKGSKTATTTIAPPGSAAVSTAPGGAFQPVVSDFAFGTAAPGTGIPGPALQAGVAGITALTAGADGSVEVVTTDGAVLDVNNGAVSLVAQLAPADGTPGGVVVAGDGSVLVSTKVGVRSLTGGAATVLLASGTAGLGATPGPLAIDGAGNLYIVDNDHHRIIRRQPDGTLTLVAGNGKVAVPGPIVGDGQKAGTVAFGSITGIAFDTRGDLLVADDGARAVRVVSPQGDVSTLAGGGSTPITDGAQGRSIVLASASGLAVDPSGRAYITDSAAGVIIAVGVDGQVRKVVSTAGPLGALALGQGNSLVFQDGAALRVVTGI